LAYLILVSSSYRHPIQLVVSGSQLYGDMLYYLSSLFASSYLGVSHSRPEGLYFWGYFIGANAPWVVVPACKFAAVLSVPICLGSMGGKGDGNWGLKKRGF